MRAGLSCALYEKQFCGGQAATTNWIENYPGFPDGIGGPELSMAMAEQAQKLGLEICYDEITELHLTDTERYAIAGGKRIDARTVVLCMGATPRPLGLAEEERLRGRGVSYCATCDGAFFRGKEVCVVGGGDTAMEDALYLARFASKVTIIHRRDSFRAAQALVRRVQQTSNVKILYHTVVKALRGEERLEEIVVQNTLSGAESAFRTQGLFVAVGTVPQTELLAGQLALQEGYVIAGEEHPNQRARCICCGGYPHEAPASGDLRRFGRRGRSSNGSGGLKQHRNRIVEKDGFFGEETRYA